MLQKTHFTYSDPVSSFSMSTLSISSLYRQQMSRQRFKHFRNSARSICSPQMYSSAVTVQMGIFWKQNSRLPITPHSLQNLRYPNQLFSTTHTPLQMRISFQGWTCLIWQMLSPCWYCLRRMMLAMSTLSRLWSELFLVMRLMRSMRLRKWLLKVRLNWFLRTAEREAFISSQSYSQSVFLRSEMYSTSLFFIFPPSSRDKLTLTTFLILPSFFLLLSPCAMMRLMMPSVKKTKMTSMKSMQKFTQSISQQFLGVAMPQPQVPAVSIDQYSAQMQEPTLPKDCSTSMLQRKQEPLSHRKPMSQNSPLSWQKWQSMAKQMQEQKLVMNMIRKVSLKKSQMADALRLTSSLNFICLWISLRGMILRKKAKRRQSMCLMGKQEMMRTSTPRKSIPKKWVRQCLSMSSFLVMFLPLMSQLILGLTTIMSQMNSTKMKQQTMEKASFWQSQQQESSQSSRTMGISMKLRKMVKKMVMFQQSSTSDQGWITILQPFVCSPYQWRNCQKQESCGFGWCSTEREIIWWAYSEFRSFLRGLVRRGSQMWNFYFASEGRSTQKDSFEESRYMHSIAQLQDQRTIILYNLHSANSDAQNTHQNQEQAQRRAGAV